MTSTRRRVRAAAAVVLSTVGRMASRCAAWLSGGPATGPTPGRRGSRAAGVGNRSRSFRESTSPGPAAPPSAENASHIVQFTESRAMSFRLRGGQITKFWMHRRPTLGVRRPQRRGPACPTLSRRSISDERCPVLHGEHGQFDSRVDAQLRVDVLQVRIDGVWGHEQLLGDVLVDQSPLATNPAIRSSLAVSEAHGSGSRGPEGAAPSGRLSVGSPTPASSSVRLATCGLSRTVWSRSTTGWVLISGDHNRETARGAPPPTSLDGKRRQRRLGPPRFTTSDRRTDHHHRAAGSAARIGDI